MSEKSAFYDNQNASRPIIVTAEMDNAAKALFTALRKAHFPPSRNFLDAHITLFHALPADRLNDVLKTTREVADTHKPMSAQVSNVRFLGNGAAFSIECPHLLNIRNRLAREFTSVLTPQDKQKFSPHITVQNKVTAEKARILYEELLQSFTPHTFMLTGIGIWEYDGGPWLLKDILPFQG